MENPRTISALEALAKKLRDVNCPADFDSMEAERAYYCALNAVAGCIEEVLDVHSQNNAVGQVEPIEYVI